MNDMGVKFVNNMLCGTQIPSIVISLGVKFVVDMNPLFSSHMNILSHIHVFCMCISWFVESLVIVIVHKL
jgi:hypothetical protein